ncbi:hypothetical protein [Prosthecobacter vanneervenii]|uniref:TolA-binding protein n=1 Tax=Prosthecobacter vanneervenii TaxID=48466 RepID=A0A7W8DIR1_9BACT|nr:hypothetical protein [Prosthecobacter vanneervenii]MBB5031338.1 TolA-binding protein [Prosthecobacter vanneervenii]
MSEPLSPTPSKTVDDVEDEDSQEALLFARCSTPAEGAAKTAAPAESPKRSQSRESSSSSSQRRSQFTGRQLLITALISLVTSVCIGVVLLIIGVGLSKGRAAKTGSTSTTAAPAAAASTGSEKTLQETLAKANEQIASLQKQVDVMRREQLLTQQNTRQSLENISATLKNPQLVPAAPATTTGVPGVSRMADAKLEVSPTQEEFIQLKERNRLTQYADEAIANGERRPLELLVEYMRDPQLPHLHDAAKAEFMRALRAIQILQREDPRYRLPVAELFKGDASIRDEADISPEALLKLLADHKQPWEVRLRVCFLLISSPLPQTNAALIKAIKEDPSLDVAKHAQLALEQRIKIRFRFFDIPAIEEWFQSQEK